MSKHMEITPRSHLNISGVLGNLKAHTSARATTAEIIASRLEIGLDNMTLNGATLYLYGKAVGKVEDSAKAHSLTPSQFILDQLSA